MNNIEIFYPTSQTQWREWLENNHVLKQSVWLVFHTKESNKETISWSDAVDVALCFGWIDSKKVKIDKYTSHQFFSKRKVNSTWSKINKEKVKRFIEEGLITKAGLDSIKVAKENGSWFILDTVEELIIPTDLEIEFTKYIGAKDYFLRLSKSNKKILLSWIVLAKRSETRQKRIEEIAKEASQNKMPKPFK